MYIYVCVCVYYVCIYTHIYTHAYIIQVSYVILFAWLHIFIMTMTHYFQLHHNVFVFSSMVSGFPSVSRDHERSTSVQEQTQQRHFARCPVNLEDRRASHPPSAYEALHHQHMSSMLASRDICLQAALRKQYPSSTNTSPTTSPRSLLLGESIRKQ